MKVLDVNQTWWVCYCHGTITEFALGSPKRIRNQCYRAIGDEFCRFEHVAMYVDLVTDESTMISRDRLFVETEFAAYGWSFTHAFTVILPEETVIVLCLSMHQSARPLPRANDSIPLLAKTT